MSKSEDNIKKTNGPEFDPMQRLASFKPPRDFSLGAAKPNKKVFTPNLNVTRAKKGAVVPNLIDHKKSDKSRRDQKRDGNKNFKNIPKVIKASGVFSEGLGSIEKHSNRAYYGRGQDSTQKTKKASMNLRDFTKTNSDLVEDQIDNSMEEEINYENVEHIQEKDEPIKLPMVEGGWLFSEPKPAITVKQDIVIKTEPTDEKVQSEPLKSKPVPRVKDEVYDETDVANVLNRETPTLLLLQLPDSLPARGGSSEETKTKPKATTSSEPTEVKEELPADNRCRLSDLQEGQIGKLRIHRSGRVSLCLGDTSFEVIAGTKPSFYQEVVSVNADDASRSATLTSLGPLHHKLNLVPNWEHMFCNMSL